MVLNLMEEGGKDINEILDMPYHYLIEILSDKKDSMREESFADAVDTLGI